MHIVATGGECKELLIWMDKTWEGEYAIHAVEVQNDCTSHSFCFTPSEERLATSKYARGLLDMDYGGYLFEPGKALMKSGSFNLTSMRFGMGKLAGSTHYYITDSIDKAEEVRKFGKVFRIISIMPLDKRSMKAVGREFPNAGVTARNIPMTSEMLKKKIGCSDGGEVHIFGLKSDTEGALLFVTERF